MYIDASNIYLSLTDLILNIECLILVTRHLDVLIFLLFRYIMQLHVWTSRYCKLLVPLGDVRWDAHILFWCLEILLLSKCALVINCCWYFENHSTGAS